MNNLLFDSKLFLRTVTNQPGVYRMYDAKGAILYVGKAKNLKKRISSYFQNKSLSKKTKVLVASIRHIDVTVTHTETEALILEQNYIKLNQPRYNILFRDDKSYPFLFLSKDVYPRLTIHRRIKNKQGEYFGPFPNSYAVYKTLAIIQKIFLIRQCENNVYRNRSRPCLQYQIGRCLGPCVDGLVSKEEYLQQVKYLRLFLNGKDNQILANLISKMEKASQKMAFEEAAKIRDQIQSIRQITKKQIISKIGDDLDVIGIFFKNGIVCIHILFIRQGKILGSHSYFPKIPTNTKIAEILEMFIGQFYLYKKQMHILPKEILINHNIKHKILLENALFDIAQRRINIQIKPRGEDRRSYLKLAHTNAITSLETQLLQKSVIHKRLSALAKLLNLSKINRIECFDISHINGEQTVASCIVFDINGPLRSEYRYYNIIDIKPRNDYSGMSQILRRRYSKEIADNKIPDVIIIDGGKNHINQAKIIFSKLNIFRNKRRPILLGVAKGNDRKTGLETLFFDLQANKISLPFNSPALHIIQYIRDESHNYAIKKCREKWAKKKNNSTLEMIKGVGPKRRQVLLKYMGGLQGLLNASIEELVKIPGISKIIAERIYFSLKS